MSEQTMDADGPPEVPFLLLARDLRVAEVEGELGREFPDAYPDTEIADDAVEEGRVESALHLERQELHRALREHLPRVVEEVETLIEQAFEAAAYG